MYYYYYIFFNFFFTNDLSKHMQNEIIKVFTVFIITTVKGHAKKFEYQLETYCKFMPLEKDTDNIR